MRRHYQVLAIGDHANGQGRRVFGPSLRALDGSPTNDFGLSG